MRYTLTSPTTMVSHDLIENYWENQTVMDKVPPELTDLISPHWLQFPPMNPIWHKVFAVYLSVIGILAFCGNGLVIYIFTTTKTLRTPSNLLVVNLAFSDFCMILCMSPAMIQSCIQETWTLGVFGCELYAMTGSLLGNTSIWTMVMIALDRYNVIVKGLAAKPLTVRTVLYRICFIWAQALLWTVLPMLGWNRYVPEGNMTACGTDYLTESWKSRSYILMYSIFVYFSPLTIIIFAYYHIVTEVARHEENMRNQAKKMNVASLRSQGDDSKTTSVEIKLAKVALMTIALWFMAWTPYLIINYSGIFKLLTVSPLFTIWGSIFAKTNAICNPIVYAISHPKYRIALKKKIPILVCGGVKDAEAGSVASGITTTTGNVQS